MIYISVTKDGVPVEIIFNSLTLTFVDCILIYFIFTMTIRYLGFIGFYNFSNIS